jgi:ribulose-bisphosphate carboxylase large chain
LHPGLVPPLVKMLGKDIIIQMGGGCHGHPWGTKSGATAIRQAIDAAINNIPIQKYAEKHKELKLALDTWR